MCTFFGRVDVAQMANILRRVFADPVAAFGRPDA